MIWCYSHSAAHTNQGFIHLVSRVHFFSIFCVNIVLTGTSFVTCQMLTNGSRGLLPDVTTV